MILLVHLGGIGQTLSIRDADMWTPCQDKNFRFEDPELFYRDTIKTDRTDFFILTRFLNCLEDIPSLLLAR